MKKFIIYLSIIGCIYSQTVGTTSDGKTVIINEDGTWQITANDYTQFDANEDIYANQGKISIFSFRDREGKPKDKILIEKLSHIEISFSDSNDKPIKLSELPKNLNFLPQDGTIWDVDFSLIDLDDDKNNELIIFVEFIMASGCNGYTQIYGRSNIVDTFSLKKEFQNDCRGEFAYITDKKVVISYEDLERPTGKFCYSQPRLRRKNESLRDYNKVLNENPMARFASNYSYESIYSDIILEYKNEDIFHPKKDFSKNTKFVEVLNFVISEINWNFDDYLVEKIDTKYSWEKKETINLLYSDGTVKSLDDINCSWLGIIYTNIAAYHFNNAISGKFTSDEDNFIQTKKLFYNVYKGPDADSRWSILKNLINYYDYKKL